MKVLASDMNLLPWGLYTERKGGTSKKKGEAVMWALHTQVSQGLDK